MNGFRKTNQKTESCILSLYIKYVALLSREARDDSDGKIKAAIASGIHLYPYRTEKLSPTAPLVLPYLVGE